MGNYSDYNDRELRSVHGATNSIIAKREYPGNSHLSILIVEGDSDRKLYENYSNTEKCSIVDVKGKQNVKDILSLLEHYHIQGVLAIVDADFDILEGKYPSSSNLLYTDTHDLETLIIKSPAFHKLLTEYGSKEKIDDFIKQSGKEDIRSYLVECGIHIGYLRWISLRENLALCFDKVDFTKFIDKQTLQMDSKKLIQTVKEKSYHTHQGRAQKQIISACDPQKSIEQIKSDIYDCWHVCCGHDLVNILSLGFNKALGSHDAGSIRPEVIERELRLSYEYSHFCQTQLYASIRKWEELNTPFIILRVE